MPKITNAEYAQVQAERKNLSQPAGLWRACEDAAESDGVSLSEWIGVQLLKALPERIRSKMGERRRPGRPCKA